MAKRQIIGILVAAGVLAAPASALGAGWVYVESNDPDRGQNSVLALKYANNGRLNPVDIREFRTRGTGAAYIRDQSVGTLAGDQQVTLSPDRRWLFAVNQGSGTIAVFRVNGTTGSLRHVKGSPFDSGGRAPISVGFNGRHLVVANHGVVAPFAPGPGADFGNPDFTSFSVSRKGRLRRISSVPAGPGPTQAHIAPSGRNVFSTSFYGFAGPANQTIQSLTLSARGRLAEAPGSPTGFPASMTDGTMVPPFLPPGAEKIAFGIATHPTRPYAYIAGPVNLRVAIYRFNRAGQLTFTGQEDNPGGIAACWIVLTSDGRYAFTANTFTQDISVFRVSRSGGDLTFLRKVPLPSTGTPFNLGIDPTDRFLYVQAGHADPDGPRPQELNPDGTVGREAPADGNFVEAFRIRSGGRLRSIGTTALPVEFSSIPMGLQVLDK
jgi:dipeptidyl aminopeptidase/acylaminoacyl peptidase